MVGELPIRLGLPKDHSHPAAAEVSSVDDDDTLRWWFVEPKRRRRWQKRWMTAGGYFLSVYYAPLLVSQAPSPWVAKRRFQVRLVRLLSGQTGPVFGALDLGSGERYWAEDFSGSWGESWCEQLSPGVLRLHVACHDESVADAIAEAVPSLAAEYPGVVPGDWVSTLHLGPDTERTRALAQRVRQWTAEAKEAILHTEFPVIMASWDLGDEMQNIVSIKDLPRTRAAAALSELATIYGVQCVQSAGGRDRWRLVPE